MCSTRAATFWRSVGNIKGDLAFQYGPNKMAIIAMEGGHVMASKPLGFKESLSKGYIIFF